MRCRELVKLSRYLDNELSLRDREAIHAHIKTCLCCRLEAKRIGEIKKIMNYGKVSSDPDLFWQRLKLRIDNDIVKAAESIFSGINAWSKRLMPVPVVVAAAFVIIFNLGVTENNLVDEYVFGTSLNKASNLLLDDTNRGLGGLLY